MPILDQPSISSEPLRRANSGREMRPPVIVLGGGANALSVARRLGRAGVAVYALNDPHEHVCHSRYARRIELPGGDVKERWAEFLLGPRGEKFRGAVLLACSDEAIELLLEHRVRLSERFILDDCNPDAQRCMLNKLCTYLMALDAGVATPKFWLAESAEQVTALRGQLVFPLLVKPLLSHLFETRFHKKYLVAHNFNQLLDAYATASDAGMKCMLVEMIPGPDDLSCSYYTYLDENSEPLFDFTKRVFRRTPVNMGRACYHITDWNPQVRDAAAKLLRHARLRGLAHVEFKRDPRDGKLKLIECNARFTAANPLLAACGVDLAMYVYRRLTDQPQTSIRSYRTGMRLWDPVADFKAFLEMRRNRQITFGQWALSLLHRQKMTYFEWSDPWPTIVHEWNEVRGIVGRNFGRLVRMTRGMCGR